MFKFTIISLLTLTVYIKAQSVSNNQSYDFEEYNKFDEEHKKLAEKTNSNLKRLEGLNDIKNVNGMKNFFQENKYSKKPNEIVDKNSDLSVFIVNKKPGSTDGKNGGVFSNSSDQLQRAMEIREQRSPDQGAFIYDPINDSTIDKTTSYQLGRKKREAKDDISRSSKLGSFNYTPAENHTSENKDDPKTAPIEIKESSKGPQSRCPKH